MQVMFLPEGTQIPTVVMGERDEDLHERPVPGFLCCKVRAAIPSHTLKTCDVQESAHGHAFCVRLRVRAHAEGELKMSMRLLEVSAVS